MGGRVGLLGEPQGSLNKEPWTAIRSAFRVSGTCMT